MKTSKLLETNGYQGFVYYSGDDVTADMRKQCFELDKRFFKEKYLYNQTKVDNWLKNYNEMCSVLYNPQDKKVIAYCFYLFISDTALQEMKENKLSYFTLGEKNLVKTKENEKVNLFCLSDACMPGWDFVEMHRIMNEYNVYVLNKLAKNKKVKVENVCIDVVCEYDEILIKQFHIDNFVETNHESKFYWGKFNPEKTWKYCKYSSALIEEYKKL